MTPQDHNKVLGVLHLVYGGAHAFGLLLMSVYLVVIGGMMKHLPPPRGGEPFPADFFNLFLGIMVAMMAIFTVLFAVPPLVAGYGLLKRKRWARKAGIVASVTAALGFPLGTALSVYSFWFLFGQGDALYKDGGKGSVAYLRDASASAAWNVNAKTSEREREYVPPTQPPDWRA